MREMTAASVRRDFLPDSKLTVFSLCSPSFEQFGKPGCINADVQRQVVESLLTGQKPPVESCMRPEFIRLAPPLHVAEDEVGG